MGYSSRLLFLVGLLGVIMPHEPRTFTEMFAGDAAWSKGLRLLGYKGTTFDARYHVDWDFLTPVGFLGAICGVMMMHRGGVLLGAPPCSTWVFMSMSSTGRHLDVMGNTHSPYVQAQNALVGRLIYVLALCMDRGIFWLIEQPASSVMFSHPRWIHFQDMCGSLIQTVKLDMGAYSLTSFKDTVIVGTAPYIKHMARKLEPAERLLVRHNGHRMHTATAFVDGAGKKRCSGGEGLKSTQAYDMGFGASHALVYQQWQSAHNASECMNAVPKLFLGDDSIGAAHDDPYLRDLFDAGFSWHSNIKSEFAVGLTV